MACVKVWWWIAALLGSVFLSFSIGLVTGAALAFSHFRELGMDVDRMM